MYIYSYPRCIASMQLGVLYLWEQINVIVKFTSCIIVERLFTTVTAGCDENWTVKPIVLNFSLGSSIIYIIIINTA